MKEIILKECLNRSPFGSWGIGAVNTDGSRKSFFLFLIPSNLLVHNILSFLVNSSLEEAKKDILHILNDIAIALDKNFLLRLISQHLNEAEKVLQERLRDNFSISVIYKHEKGFYIPFFTTDENNFFVDSEEEMLEQFIPLLNEWITEKEGYKVGFNGEKFIFNSNAILKVEKINSKQDAKILLKKELQEYEKIKQEYPQEAKLVEEIYRELL